MIFIANCDFSGLVNFYDLMFSAPAGSPIKRENVSWLLPHRMGCAPFAITGTLASTALGTECLNECRKNSKHKQEMYEKKSKNDPFHCHDLTKVS